MRRFLHLRVWLLSLMLLPASALAQSTRWSATRTSGYSVMEEVSEVVFEVRNTSTVTSRINQVTLALNSSTYELDGGEAPSGWTVTSLDRVARRITFTATGTCPSLFGLSANSAASFTLRVVGYEAAGDATDSLLGGGTGSTARDICNTGTSFTASLTNATWTRHGLAARLFADPRSLHVNGEVFAQLILENRTTRTQSSLYLNGPGVQGDAAFDWVTYPTPSSLSLSAGAAGAFSARVRGLSAGLVNFYADAENNGANSASSPVVFYPHINVGTFATHAEVLPLQALTGETVTLKQTVVNNTGSVVTNVVPRAPVLIGNASVTLLTSPSSVASLASGSSAVFYWTYRVTGAGWATYQFQNRVDAVRNSSTISTVAVLSDEGRVAEHRLTINPEAVIPGSARRTLSYTVYNGGTQEIRAVKLLTPDAALFRVASSPFSSGNTTGWTTAVVTGTRAGYSWTVTSSSTAGIAPGQSKVFTLDYDLIGTVTSPSAFSHRMQLTQGTGSLASSVRVDGLVTITPSRTVSEVQNLVGLAAPNRITLSWTNPADHEGVLIVRTTTAGATLTVTPGMSYRAGDVLGSWTVVYADANPWSQATSAADTLGLQNGQSYYYRVLNYSDLHLYSAGLVPSSQGLLAIPTGRGSGEPLWCYSVGYSSLLQPITELGQGIFSASNGALVSNLTRPTGPEADGSERWRPTPLSGMVQSRFPLVPLHGRTGQYILTGDQAGTAYAINASTGQTLWSGNGGVDLQLIQSFPVAQLHDYALASYKAAFPNRDLAFFASRQNSGTANKVVALDAQTGARVWVYAPGDLGRVSGGMLVDYDFNRLYVGANSNGGTLASLRVLNSLTGVELARFNLGDLDFGIVRGLAGQLYANNADGWVYGINMTTLTLAWSSQVATRTGPTVPVFSSFVRPLGDGFVASLQSGKVERFKVDGTAVTKLWSTTVAGASGLFAQSTGSVTRLYVGGSDGKVHELNWATGVDGRQVQVGATQRIGTPTVDRTVNRLHVGTQDGRICAFSVPFQ